MARKKTKVKAAPRRKAGKLAGPSWQGWENLTGQAFGRLQRLAADFYYQEYKPADLMPSVYDWMKNNGYSTKEITSAKKADISPVIGIYCRLIQDGCPDFNPVYAEYWEALPGTAGKLKPLSEFLHEAAKKAVEQGAKVVAVEKAQEQKKATVYTPTIQERIHDQCVKVTEEIDVWLEGFITNPESFNAKGFDFKTHFRKAEISQAHARKIIGFYDKELEDYREIQNIPTSGQLGRMDELEADQWVQLKEGYGHLKKGEVQKYITAIEGLIDACNYVIDQSKATRKPRKAKPRSADKVVSGLKYAPTNDKYKLASVNPTDIVGASELWVFNVKTRKLGKYVAANVDPTGMAREGSGLSVKGTSIVGYDEKQSIQKTLRKPEEQLKEFKASGKVALRKFLDGINTTDTTLNGRINPDTILLKVN